MNDVAFETCSQYIGRGRSIAAEVHELAPEQHPLALRIAGYVIGIRRAVSE